MEENDERQCEHSRPAHKRYGDLEVLKGIDLEIPSGQTVAVIGPSGSSKSTLLRVLMTLERPSGGEIEIDGVPMWTDAGGKPAGLHSPHLRKVRGKIGMVFQHFNLFPHDRAGQRHGGAAAGTGPESRAGARAWRRIPGDGGLGRQAGHLSRAAVRRPEAARWHCAGPGHVSEIMLFDEVTSALDPELVGGILQILRDLPRAAA